MTRIRIAEEKCTRCGQCIRICPLGLLKPDEAAGVSRIADAERLCIACGHCAASCPVAAIRIGDTPPEAMEPCDVPLPSFEEVRRLVRRRRSVRLYQQRPVPAAQIEQLIDATRWAPTARNSQQVAWSVVAAPARVRELAGLTVEWFRGTGQAPGLVSAWEHGYDMVLRGAPHLVVVHGPVDGAMPATDGVIAATTFELLARAAGLGTCWAGFFLWAVASHAPLRQAIELPEAHAVHAALMLGHPLAAYLRVPPRSPARVAWVGGRQG